MAECLKRRISVSEYLGFTGHKYRLIHILDAFRRFLLATVSVKGFFFWLFVKWSFALVKALSMDLKHE